MSAQRTTVATFPEGVPVAGLPYLIAAMEHAFGEHLRIGDGDPLALFSQGERLTDEQMDARLQMMRDYAAPDPHRELREIDTVEAGADFL